MMSEISSTIPLFISNLSLKNTNKAETLSVFHVFFEKDDVV